MATDLTRAKSLSLAGLGIRQKLAITFTLIIILILLLTVYLITLQEKHASFRRAQDSGKIMGNVISLGMGEDIVRHNFQGISFAMKEFTRRDLLKYCTFLANNGKIISGTDPKLIGKYLGDAWSRATLSSNDIRIRRAFYAGGMVYDTAIPILIGGKRYGVLRLGFSMKKEQDYIRQLLLYNLSLGTIFILIGIVIAYSLSATFLLPITSLLQATEQIGKGDFSVRAQIHSSGEFEQLALSLNRMTDELQQREDLRKYLSQSPKSNIESVNGITNRIGRRHHAVILFADIRDFIGFSERHEPEEIVEYLNSFFDQMVQAITISGGIVDKFIGDSIMTIFLPQENDRWAPEIKAVLAALRMQQYLADFNLSQSQLGREEFQIDIRIHSGPVVLGTVGTGGHLQFTALGNTVNVASCLRNFSDDSHESRILVSQNIWLKVKDFVIGASVGKHSLKGKHNQMELYSIDRLTNLEYFRGEFQALSKEDRSDFLPILALTNTRQAQEVVFNFMDTAIVRGNLDQAISAIDACKAFLAKREASVIAKLQNLAKESPHRDLAASAISALALCRNDDFAQFFLEFIADEHPRIRANTLEALLSLNFSNKRDCLEKMAKDPDARVSTNALLGLWALGDFSIMEFIIQNLQSEDSRLRASTAFAIYSLSTGQKFRILFQPKRGEADEWTFPEAAQTILNLLVKQIQAAKPPERLQAVKALALIGHKTHLAALTDILSTEDNRNILLETEKAIESIKDRLGY